MIRSILIAFLAALVALLVVERLIWRPAPQKIVVVPVQTSPSPATRVVTLSLNPRRIRLSVDFQQTPFEEVLKQIEKLAGGPHRRCMESDRTG